MTEKPPRAAPVYSILPQGPKERALRERRMRLKRQIKRRRLVVKAAMAALAKMEDEMAALNQDINAYAIKRRLRL